MRNNVIFLKSNVMGIFDFFRRKKANQELDVLSYEDFQDLDDDNYEEMNSVEIKRNKKALADYKMCLSGNGIMPIDAIGPCNTSFLEGLTATDFCMSCFDYLNKLTLPSGLLLTVKQINCGTWIKKQLVVKLPNGYMDSDIFKYLNVEESLEGVWQAYVILAFSARFSTVGMKHIFKKEDISNIKLLRKSDQDNVIASLLGLDVTPTIGKIDNKYFVSCCYFSQWAGLIREYMEFVVVNNKVTDSFVFDGIKLYQYDCGIMI